MNYNASFDAFDKITIKTCEGYIFKHRFDLIRFEACHNQTYLYLINEPKPILIPINLKSVECNFMQPEFFRCHKSHYINLLHVLKYITKTHEIHTQNGIVPLADEKIKAFEDKMLGKN